MDEQLVENFKIDSSADKEDNTDFKLKLSNVFVDVVTIYKIGNFKNVINAKFGQDFVYLSTDKNSPIAAAIGALSERFLFLGPFTWKDYYKFCYSATTLTQVFYKNYPFKTYASVGACIRYLKKHNRYFFK